VVVLSFGEVNTARDPIREQNRISRRRETAVGALKGRIYPDVKPIRQLCDQFGTVLHIDGR